MMLEEPDHDPPSRRGFLRGLVACTGLGLAAGGGLIGGLLPKPALALVPVRALRLASRQLGEEVRTVYFADGRYQRQGLREIRRLFRDKHNEHEIDIDPDLLDALWSIQRQLSPRDPLEVLCGYRSPATNAKMRLSSRGVAANSYHMYGKAIDLRIPGCPVATVHRVAVGLEVGGVGYYPRSNFVHIDTGPVRRWGQTGRVTSARKAVKVRKRRR